jgi:hypothetical protein
MKTRRISARQKVLIVPMLAPAPAEAGSASIKTI